MATKLHEGKTFKYVGVVNHKIGQGAFGFVFVGQFKSDPGRPWETYGREMKAAIKRVVLFGKSTYSEIENDREVIALKKLNHPYIVRLFAVEDDEDFRNFVFELCQANLEEFISKTYTGAMPQELEGLFHMASGLEYIHDNKMIHRDIKPENVLISVSGNGKARLKIADLGFIKQFQDKRSHFDVTSGIKGTEYYMAAELLRLKNQRERDFNNNCTTATDIFATGITFFRLLFEGLHPFGVGYKIEGNIIKGEAINLIKELSKKVKPEWRLDLVKNMTQLEIKDRLPIREVVGKLKSRLPNFKSDINDHTSTQVIIVERNSEISNARDIGDQGLKFDLSEIIDKRGRGIVFKGYFKGEKVAVKRVQLMDTKRSGREFQNLSKLKHQNVVCLIHHEDDRDFRYIVIELCKASLDQLFLEEGDPNKYKGPMPTDEQVLFQLASGLDYIHSRNIVHRNIKPENILISLSKPVQLKWAGFGLSTPISSSGLYSGGIERKGTQNWMAPEVLEYIQSSQKNFENFRFTTKTDIFATGCVFFYFLLKGVHPFGSEPKAYILVKQIMKGNPINLKGLPYDHFASEFIFFIKKMIDHDPAKRIPLSEVIVYLNALQPTIRLSSMLYNHQNMLFCGSFSKVFLVSDFEGKSLAVKITDYFSTENFEKLKELNHSNIIQFYYFEQEDDSSYIAMELCDASLDMFFLSDGDRRKYGGPMPSNEEFCFQLASGLQYIHKMKLVHGSIKPSNILIKGLQIKLSDFGLTQIQWNDGQMSSSAIGGFQNARFWLAPELIEKTSDINSADFHQHITEKSDIFAAGCVSFYFFSKGRHLFGDEIHTILPNIVEGKRANLPIYKLNKTDCILMLLELIKSMTEKLSQDRPELTKIIEELKQPFQQENLDKVKGNISYIKNRILGRGGQACVFLGFFNENQVAVKRIGNIDMLDKIRKQEVYRERENFKKLVHPNILKFFGDAEEGPFLFLALERCLISLDSYCQKSLPYRDLIPMPSEVQVLLQMAEGLQFIHNKRIIHRDVKPANVLISFDYPAVIKWADFGLSRTVTTGSRTFTWSANQMGTERWMAPELINASQKEKMRGSIKCDIFALGCVFFYFLQSGSHPFGTGDKHIVQHNIKEGKRINLDVFRGKHDAYKLIEGMTENDRELRIRLPTVIDRLKSFPNEHIEKNK